MEYRALTSFKVKQQGQTNEIKAGQLITLSDDKAGALLAKGLIEPFCFWLARETEKHNEGGICCSSHTSCPNWQIFWEKRKAELRLHSFAG